MTGIYLMWPVLDLAVGVGSVLGLWVIHFLWTQRYIRDLVRYEGRMVWSTIMVIAVLLVVVPGSSSVFYASDGVVSVMFLVAILVTIFLGAGSIVLLYKPLQANKRWESAQHFSKR